MGRNNRTRRGRLPQPEVRPDDSNLTRFAGVVPLIAYLTQVLRLPSRLREIVGAPGRRRTHPVHHVLFAFVVGALVGTERMAHLEWLRDDVVLLKYLRLASWPVRKVFALGLAGVSQAGVAALEALVGDVARVTFAQCRDLVLDIDNTAIVDYGTGEGSKFGYCGKGRRRRRHYPIVASVGETRAIVAAKYRDGSEMTDIEVELFVDRVVTRLRGWLGDAIGLTVRADGGFWSPGFTAWLQQRKLPFVLGMHMTQQLKLRLMIATWEARTGDPDIEFSVVGSADLKAGTGMRVVVIRRRVHDQKAPPSRKVVSWSPEWRYQALITDRDWAPEDVWRFYNYRGESERVFRIGKQQLAMGHLVSRDLRTNEVAFLLRALAYNADIAFQMAAEQQAVAEGRPVVHNGLAWRQVRFSCSPGRLLFEAGRWVLRTAVNRKLSDLWRFYAPQLLADGA
jgi:Transposase DDE domain group 1